ncbi:MAG: hypothetical protein WC943_10495, partial [Elusimicrobiota bacterium]
MTKRMLCAAVVVLLSVGPSFAAYANPKKQAPKTGLSGLLARISAYMNSQPVLKARTTAVAAVRGGIPTDQGEDLDQRLLDRASYLRERVLATGDSRDESALRRVYQALSVSQLVQALELPLEPGMRAETRTALKAWSGLRHTPSLPRSLKAFLADIPDKPEDKAFVTAGWPAYCRSITPELSSTRAVGPSGKVAAQDTARLDEALGGLRKTWMEKAVAPPDAAQAHFLAGF